MNEAASRKLAEKIARILEAESRPTDLAALYASIDKLNRRIDKLEQSASVTELTAFPAHPSGEKFSVAEAVADELFSKYKKEKICLYEPNGKPCDHCSMCSSRGF